MKNFVAQASSSSIIDANRQLKEKYGKSAGIKRKSLKMATGNKKNYGEYVACNRLSLPDPQWIRCARSHGMTAQVRNGNYRSAQRCWALASERPLLFFATGMAQRPDACARPAGLRARPS
ncbi:hypothetical protein [Paraburkholderia acidisoli]|uniref:Uncharacterized protein n=1 Tax=Paraburkholderia acidisoli TaxID=2571748 RepID=A0A7Z2GF80_9BURK|nr:hypothetical protein [Paraburkholderia acidisoli]QGZ60692.1 hypothetical protein FAZ98_02470 [Paraburkholderia acidisoli]